MPKRHHKETIETNLGLVAKMARHYSGHDIPFDDLFQEGIFGLQEAIKRFNPQMGYKFSTYATWWIRRAIMRAFHNQGRSDISFGDFNLMLRMKRDGENLTQELGHEPTARELAQQMGLRPQKIEQLKNLGRGPLSLNLPIRNRDGEETKETLGDRIVSEGKSSDPLARVLQEELRGEITSLIERLGPKQREVLERRFPAGDQEPQTLDKIGADLGITRERVRQIQGEGLEQIRRLPPSLRDRIKPFLED